MSIENSSSLLATLAGQTVLVADCARSEIRQALEMDIPEQARTLLEKANKRLGVLMEAAAQTQLTEET